MIGCGNDRPAVHGLMSHKRKTLLVLIDDDVLICLHMVKVIVGQYLSGIHNIFLVRLTEEVIQMASLKDNVC